MKKLKFICNLRCILNLAEDFINFDFFYHLNAEILVLKPADEIPKTVSELPTLPVVPVLGKHLDYNCSTGTCSMLVQN